MIHPCRSRRFARSRRPSTGCSSSRSSSRTRGADARGRHRLRGQAVVPAVGELTACGWAGASTPPASTSRAGRRRRPQRMPPSSAAARALHRLPAPRHGHGDEEAQPRRSRRHRLLRPHDLPPVSHMHSAWRWAPASLWSKASMRAGGSETGSIASSATRLLALRLTGLLNAVTSAPTSRCSSRTTASRP